VGHRPQVADRAVWGADHPYGRAVGSREVASATKAEACAFFDDHYAPDRAIMVVVGNFDPARCSRGSVGASDRSPSRRAPS
jgi:predicted Zn-dependent peptidase